MNLSCLTDLVAEWRSEAALFRQRGMEAPARQAESYAAQLEDRLAQWAREALTLEKAVAESGYSRSTLERRIETGQLPNVGRAGAPRVRRIDLPHKGGRASLVAVNEAPDVASELLARRASV